MAPILSDYNGSNVYTDINTPADAEKTLSGINDTEAEIIENFLKQRKSNKKIDSSKVDTDVIDLDKRRADILNWNKQNYGKKYDKVCEETIDFIKTCEQTDEYITLGKLKLRKKPLQIDVNHKNNKDKDVFTYEWDNYSGGKDTMVGIKQKVLNDDTNSMHNVVEEEIKAQEGYRQATKADFDKMLSQLPGKNEEENLLALQIVTGWFGWGILDAVDIKKGKVLSRSFVRLSRDAFYRYFNTGDSQSGSGSVFLVQDCE